MRKRRRHYILFRISRRLAQSIVVLFGLSILIFVIARVIPGDPALLSLGPLAPEEKLQAFREAMHLGEPLYIQYYYWLGNALQGDLGSSVYSGRPVVEDIKEFFPATLELMLFAFVITVVVGQLLGITCGRYSNTWIDNVGRVIAYFGVVTPSFVFAIMFMLLFGYFLNILPPLGRLSWGIECPPIITGMITLDGLLTGHFAATLDALRHLIMPAAALAMAGLALEARITRSSMVDNSQKDYIIAARAWGIPDRIIMFKYLLKPSFIPTVSVIGLDFAVLLSNAFLVELVFGWPGFSCYGIKAMLYKDLNAMCAVVMILGVLFVLANIIVDIIVSYLDPRIKLGLERSE